MAFIKLTAIIGGPLYVNESRIDAVYKDNEGAAVFTGGSDNPFRVSETPEMVIDKINADKAPHYCKDFDEGFHTGYTKGYKRAQSDYGLI